MNVPPLDRLLLSEYDARRNLEQQAVRSVCNAPFVSLLLDPKGFVRACCQDWTHSYGNIREQRLSEIWRGAAIEAFRHRLAAYELPDGCATCRWQIEQGNYDAAFSRNYDRLVVREESPAWPQSLELMMSNTCNLECVQCVGELSSTIRAHREKLPPLPRVYGDEFFEDLRSFLPHLVSVTFLGGEPFLGRENFRVWDMMAEDGVELPCVATTNGTVWNQRVEQVLDRFPFLVIVSMDGATKGTVERIRQNADFDKILVNIDRFKARARRGVGLSFCLMPQNCLEFPQFLILAEELDCDVLINKVYQPPQFSMSSLGRHDLRALMTKWEEIDAHAQSRLTRHRDLWVRELQELRNQVAQAPDPPRLVLSGICRQFADARSGDLATRTIPEARSLLLGWSSGGRVDEARIGSDDTVMAAGGFAGLDAAEIDGRPLSYALLRLLDRYGAEADVAAAAGDSRSQDRTMTFTDREGKRTGIRWIAVADNQGDAGGAALLIAVRPENP